MIARAEGRPAETWSDATPGAATWVTLFSADRTPSRALSAGVATLPQGGFLPLHRHTQAEIYHLLEGKGVMTIDGTATNVRAGDSVFIPGDAEHGIRNSGAAALRFFYVFPVDRFDQVVYRFNDNNKETPCPNP